MVEWRVSSNSGWRGGGKAFTYVRATDGGGDASTDFLMAMKKANKSEYTVG